MSLIVDWCSYEAAKYAVEKWHYSKSMPAGKLAKFGVWEDGVFIGSVIYGRGANKNIGTAFLLKSYQVAELVRVALSFHRSPVSQIISMTNKILVSQSPGLRLLVSYADPREGHVGIIYQSLNWIYTGMTKQSKSAHYKVRYPTGEKVVHGRSVRAKWGSDRNIPYRWEYALGLDKYKYLYPLDKAMRRQIEPLSQPYPKHADMVQNGKPAAVQVADTGSIPVVRFNTVDDLTLLKGNG